MEYYEYKVVGAPERVGRQRGARNGSDRLAVAIEAVLNREATDGWEYVRSDTMTVEEKASLLARRRPSVRTVLVFRRAASARRLTQAEKVEARPPVPLRERPDRRSEPEIRLAHSADDDDR